MAFFQTNLDFFDEKNRYICSTIIQKAMGGSKYIRFDWAMKHLLRQKANFGILEGVREEGRLEGRKEGREEGRAEGREEGRKEGREEGRKEGLEEGRTEERKENAKRMKALGLPADTIAKVTGLPLADIESL